MNNKLQRLPSWQALSVHAKSMQSVCLRDLFSQQSDRFDQFSIYTDDILFDYSKNICTAETIQCLIRFAQERAITQWRDKLFNGEKINFTEDRAVLHPLLRDLWNEETLCTAPSNDRTQVRQVLDQMTQICQHVQQGSWRGYSNKAITDVVHIGIGGSHLGPQLAIQALNMHRVNNLNVHFLSNVDGHQCEAVLARVEPESTLFIVASKTFTTSETLLNAHTARQWLVHRSKNETAVAHHFFAVTAAVEKAKAFGIPAQNCLPMWDWVGGRFSIWSAIGLPVALAIGMDHFKRLLAGAHHIDRHFKTAELNRNIPVLLALLMFWYQQWFNAHAIAVIPYDTRLSLLPAYLQQLEMESNGKFVDREGDLLGYLSQPILFGGVGTDGQHAFFQLLHQGTSFVPLDFIAAVNPNHEFQAHHRALLANCFAQLESFMWGRNEEETLLALSSKQNSDQKKKQATHQIFLGNRPSNIFLLKELNPFTLGALLAIYEHKVFVYGVLLGINSFDQMGVELGKHYAVRLLSELQSSHTSTKYDSSTNGLINQYKKWTSKK